MRDKFSSSKFSGVIAAMILTGGMTPALAEDVVAARNIRAGDLIEAADIVTPAGDAALRMAAGFIGLEAARSIYKGQPLSKDDLRRPTLIERNAIVTMEFVKGPMLISTEGRALDNGGDGDRIRVMNLLSKRIVSAVVVNANTVRTKQ
ncbi:MAG: flagellar basal body P-ring formation chaperone FlgA [Pseudomonadota bacterium]|nr:flagellar basal body P-ring formation chaperone FlgA [Pseudomonadota bacterium]